MRRPRIPKRTIWGLNSTTKKGGGLRGASRSERNRMRSVLGGDARVALAKLIPSQSVHAVHVYFPGSLVEAET